MTGQLGRQNPPRRLLVIVSDRVSDWVQKGEIVDRYFNPGEVFDEVHLMLTNDDRPLDAALRRMAGRAAVHVHNVPAGRAHFALTGGWRPWLLRRWSRRAVALARRIDPDLVRCHGARINGFAGAEIRRRLQVPLVISLHINPDVDYRRHEDPPLRQLAARAMRDVELAGLRTADLVLPVYEPIVDYLDHHGIAPYLTAYNVVGQGVRPREDYRLRGTGLHVVTVSRQLAGHKDPSPLLEAAARLSFVRLTLIGDGPLHDTLVRRAAVLGLGTRAVFVRAMPNEGVLRVLQEEADVFAYASSYYELSKGCMEAALAGLPLVVGRRAGAQVSELAGPHVSIVEPSGDGFADAFAALQDEAERARLGRAAAGQAWALWPPDRSEARVADAYRRLLATPR